MKINPINPDHSVKYSPTNPKYIKSTIMILHEETACAKDWVRQWKNTNELVVPFILRKTHTPNTNRTYKK